MQCCSLSTNLSLLNDYLEKSRSQNEIDKFNGLIAVLDELTAKSVKNGISCVQSILSIEYALEVYLGYKTDYVAGTKTADDRKSFEDNLLHPQYGLRVYVVNLPFTKERFIVLKPNDVDLAPIFNCFARSFLQGDVTKSRIPVRCDVIQGIILTVDTEWDRKVARVLLCANRTRSEIEMLGINSQHVVSATKKVLDTATKWEDTKLTSKDIVKKRLHMKVEKLTNEIGEIDKLLAKKRGVWSEARIQDLVEKRLFASGRLDSLKEMLKTENSVKFKQMITRQAKQLFENNRAKKRKKSNQGRPVLIDSDDEDFISKAIEDKSSYHGRRSDLVLYTNKRVKKRDLKNIVNFHRKKKGKKLIKSSTTAYNRARPRCLRSLQSKKHLGKGLFCFKKPPKAEDQSNENTHYQRAHVKNIKMTFFSNRQLQHSHLSFMRSTDDKAYIRPGTSEGLEKTRNTRILTLSDVNKARKLPKYDWPERLVFITPGSHRIFTKKGVVDDQGNETLITNDDFHFVVVRPKAIVGSSGSVWASETVRLRHEQADAFEIQTDSIKYSVAFRRFCARLQDSLYLYVDMSEEEDLKKMTNKTGCLFVCYEVARARCAQRLIEKSIDEFEKSDASEGERTLINSQILGKSQKIVESLTNLVSVLQTTTFIPEEAIKIALALKEFMNNTRKIFIELNLPRVKPRWADLTDAGPGVGVSNFSVQFRDAELARLYNSDYRIRCHRSRGDSGQGEAERTNSAIGDAVVDGGTIEWEVFKRFEDLTQEEVDAMSVKEFEAYEKKRMEKNAWSVAQNIAARIDDTPVLGNYITALISDGPNDAFFIFEDLLQKFHRSTSETAKEAVPGAAYIKKVKTFYEMHYSRGELFMEFIRDGCVDSTGELCEYCEVNRWVGDKMTRIPQPVPDSQRPNHYFSVFDTSTLNEHGRPREPDDWQPRAQIKKLFQKAEITAANEENIKKFAERYCVEEILVKKYLEHLQELKTMDEIRSRSRKEEREKRKEKTYNQYDWLKLAMDGSLKSLKVAELNKYLESNGLTKTGKKEDKIKAITCHVIRAAHTNDISGQKKIEKYLEELADESNSDVSQSDSSDNDEVIAMLSDDSTEEENEFDDFQAYTVTRSGRVVGSWKNAEMYL